MTVHLSQLCVFPNSLSSLLVRHTYNILPHRLVFFIIFFSVFCKFNNAMLFRILFIFMLSMKMLSNISESTKKLTFWLLYRR